MLRLVDIMISYDQLVLAPILSQMIESFAEIADLVGHSRKDRRNFWLWVVSGVLFTTDLIQNGKPIFLVCL